jgi:hypothetical protein
VKNKVLILCGVAIASASALVALFALASTASGTAPQSVDAFTSYAARPKGATLDAEGVVSAPAIVFTPTYTSCLPIVFHNFIYYRFRWESDYEAGFTDWGGYPHQQGGTVEVVPDPTSSGKGLVQRSIASVGGDPPELEEPPMLLYRLYPAVYFSFVPSPCEITEDVWASRDLLQDVTQDDNWLVVGPDVFDKTPEDGGVWNSFANAAITKSSVVGGKVYLRLNYRNPGGFAPIQPGSPEFAPEQWHNVRIVIQPDRHIELYQDTVLVAQATLPDTVRAGLVGGHPGLYAGRLQSLPPLRGTLLVDNWAIRCW